MAQRDPALAARVVTRASLVYDEGAAPALDRPAHVRAGSALAWVGARIAVVQDDANFVALVTPGAHAQRPGEHAVYALALPPGEAGLRQFDVTRGNKKHKLDLEACLALTEGEVQQLDPTLAAPDGALLAFGSGSTEKRERVVLVIPSRGGATDERTRVYDARAFYASLRACEEFAGSELNIEGCARAPGDPSTLVLVQRGNGAGGPRFGPVDATAELSLEALLAHLRDPTQPAPPLRALVVHSLGTVDQVRLTFTDAASNDRALYLLAAAEGSPNAVDDGPVRGVALCVRARDEALEAPLRMALVHDEQGQPLLDKVEGLALHPTEPGRFYAVVDRDDPAHPAQLLELALEGPWER